MNISKAEKTIKVERKFEGILDAVFEHKIESTKATLNYTGPKIDPETWFGVLAFFQWTWETTKSESQVRLFLNPSKKLWVPWAFPQEARTGMSAKEIDCPAKNDQRSGLPDAKDLVSFGTMHHHCSMAAFQSGTDETDELTQDGLHITIGKVDEKMYDLHARFYLNKTCFDPDMALFWEIGEDLRKMVPRNLWNQIARFQMCQKIEKPFPDQWKENLVEVKTVITGYQGGLGYQNNNDSDWRGYGCVGSYKSSTSTVGIPEWQRVELAAERVMELAFEAGYRDDKEMEKLVMFLYQDKAVEAIFDACNQLKVPIDMVVRELATSWSNYTGLPDVTEPEIGKKESKRERKRRLRKEALKAKESNNGDGEWSVTSVMENGIQMFYLVKGGDMYEPAYHSRMLADERAEKLNESQKALVLGKPFIPAAKIEGVDVMWREDYNCYINSLGNTFNAETKTWVPVKEKESNKTPQASGNGIYNLAGKYCQFVKEMETYVTLDHKDKWDDNKKSWITIPTT